MKKSNEIVKWGRPKPFFKSDYSFNTIDIETIDNELFLIGTIRREQSKLIYTYTESDFFNYLNDLFINCVQNNRDILSWSRYDNTFIIKTLIEQFDDNTRTTILKRIGKLTPLFEYNYKHFRIEITNVIKENIIITIYDAENHKKRITLYNLKNLFTDDLETSAKDYKIKYYTKMGREFHIIDRERYYNDNEYKKGVLKSNELDNRVLLDLAHKLLENFRTITGKLPKTMFTAGSLARAYLLTMDDIAFNFHSLMKKNRYFNKVLDYSMRAYHGGKIDSYVIGYIKQAKSVDITSAYPYALTQLPKLTNEVVVSSDTELLNNFFYAYIKCIITIDDEKLIHPVTVQSPINVAKISPIGTFEAVITKPEYDYLLKKGCKVEVIDYVAIHHIENEYPYRDMIHNLFNSRMKYRKSNPALSNLYKLILNSLYGIHYELTDTFKDGDRGDIEWLGYRAGDFFNPLIASYITSITRTYLSTVSHNVIENGGSVYLNMTDSIIYDGEITLDVFSDEKVLGKFEPPTTIKKVMILGAGRYEYYDTFKKVYNIKTRGFNVKRRDESFYSDLNFEDEQAHIKHNVLVTFFRATTKKYDLTQLGHLIDEDYKIDPFNLGGKRIIDNFNINIKKEYTTTRPIRL